LKNPKFFVPKIVNVRIWRTHSPSSEKWPHWTKPLPPDCWRLLWTDPY